MSAIPPSQPDPWMVEAFQTATTEFKRRLKDTPKFDFSQYGSAKDVYEKTRRIQAEQVKSGSLRALNRISPYLKCLAQYESAIKVFVQVKPELLALIWVCISLL
jgi:hypothetical protein